MNNSGIKKQTAVAPTQILFMTNPYAAVSVTIDNTTVETDSFGNSYIPAGMPVTIADIKDRTVAGTVATGGNVTGVLLHDAYIQDGLNVANASLLMFGFVNVDRLGTVAKAAITPAIETALSGKIWFLSDK